MKINGTKRTAKLPQSNEQTCIHWLNGEGEHADLVAFLVTMCKFFDEVASGEDLYVVMGKTKNGDALTVTFKLNGVGETIYGDTVESLGSQMEALY